MPAQGGRAGKGPCSPLHDLSPGDCPYYIMACLRGHCPLSMALRHTSYPRPGWREHCECVQETSDGLLNYSLEQFLPRVWSQSPGVFSGQVPEALRRSCDVLEGRGSVWSEVHLVPEPWMWGRPPRASGFLFLEQFMTPLLSSKWGRDRASSDQSSLLSPMLLVKGCSSCLQRGG